MGRPPFLRLVVLAADPLARAGIEAFLAEEEGLEVAGRAGFELPLDEAWFDLYRPDLVLVDLPAGIEPGGEILSACLETGLPLVVLLPDAAGRGLTEHPAFAALLRRDIGAAPLGAAIRAVGQGLRVRDPRLDPERPEAGGPGELAGLSELYAATHDPLTPRELEVLGLVAAGLTNRAIAHRLAISENTVKFHLNAILPKLGAASRTEAAIAAARLGLIAL